MNEAQAKQIAEKNLSGSTITDIEDFGELYAVYFVNDEYYKSGDIRDMMVGAGPLFVEKSSGTVFRTGSGQSAKEYARAYRECGDLYARPGATIQIFGINADFDKSALVLKFKQINNTTLQKAKQHVEHISIGNKIEIKCQNECEAQEKQQLLSSSGFLARQLWERCMRQAHDCDAMRNDYGN